ncbi:MAG: hypothetical protein ABIT01_02035 [Thermoanaerobaculia bacterium]
MSPAAVSKKNDVMNQIRNDVMNGDDKTWPEEESMKTNKVSFAVDGAFPYTEAIQVPDERTVECIRELRELFGRFSGPKKGRRKGTSGAPDAEPETTGEPVPPPVP